MPLQRLEAGMYYLRSRIAVTRIKGVMVLPSGVGQLKVESSHPVTRKGRASSREHSRVMGVTSTRPVSSIQQLIIVAIAHTNVTL